jgi:hypothetical protein
VKARRRKGGDINTSISWANYKQCFYLGRFDYIALQALHAMQTVSRGLYSANSSSVWASLDYGSHVGSL